MFDESAMSTNSPFANLHLSARKIIVAVLFTTAVANPALANGTLQVDDYGTTADGQKVNQYTMTNRRGMTVRFISYGGIITDIITPDRDGHLANVVLGFSKLADYEKHNGNIHFGALIGRYANRIANGRFSLNGHEYRLPINASPNSMHGGNRGFDRFVWQVKPIKQRDGVAAELTLVSPNGDEGYPGKLTVKVTYQLTDDNALRIDYRAATDSDTVVNLTNHSYFNLAGNGKGSVENHLVQIAASRYTPTDATSIPTGELAPVTGTPFDFRTPMTIGARLRAANQQLIWAQGYDQNWVLDNGGKREPGFAARVSNPRSGRMLEIYTTQPGLQFYTGNGLDGSVVGSANTAYRQTDGFAVEAEHFPDSPNKPQFPSTELKPGQTLQETTILKFSVR